MALPICRCQASCWGYIGGLRLQIETCLPGCRMTLCSAGRLVSCRSRATANGMSHGGEGGRLFPALLRDVTCGAPKSARGRALWASPPSASIDSLCVMQRGRSKSPKVLRSMFHVDSHLPFSQRFRVPLVTEKAMRTLTSLNLPRMTSKALLGLVERL